MYVEVVANRKSPPAILLRETFREGGKVRKRTIANLSSFSMAQVASFKLLLKGQLLAPVDELFNVVASRHHGHADAVVHAMKRLKLDKLLGAKRCRERQLVMVMIAARILHPRSKLATATSLGNTTLPELLGIEGTNENELYVAMDWLLERQKRIEKKLAKRHLPEGSLALYDLSSSYFEGDKCPLAARGYSRDRKKGKLQLNYGLLTDRRGCPIAISVFKGNVSDCKTLLPQVKMLRDNFSLDDFVIVGDRGMITQTQIRALREEDVQWITALRPGGIRKLIEDRSVTPELFDERNLAEIEHPDFPGERLVVCRNPEVAKRRVAKRNSMLDATTRELETVCRMVNTGRLSGQDKIGLRAGRVVNKYKMAKHFVLDVKDDSFTFERNDTTISTEAALDGIYIVRTSLPKDSMVHSNVVRSYKLLSNVERAFRTIKTDNLYVRPIHHRTEQRVRAHILLCMLAYYVRWYMLEAWRPLLYCDEDQAAKLLRDPVAPATRSNQANRKASTKTTADGTRAHSFRSLLDDLSTLVRNTCTRPRTEDADAPFDVDTRPSHLQLRALDLIKTIQL